MAISKETIVTAAKKYHLDFWFGALVQLALMIVAIISGFLYAATYFSLAITYFLVLCISVPSFLVNERLRKKYQDDGAMLFKRKHIIPLFASGILILEFTAVIAINFQYQPWNYNLSLFF